MTADQRRRSAQILATMEAEDRHTTQLALAQAPIDPAYLSSLLQRDKLAAAAQLADLDDRQLLAQAIVCSSFVNETYGFDAHDGVQTEEMLLRLQQIAGVYRATRVEVEPSTIPLATVPADVAQTTASLLRTFGYASATAAGVVGSERWQVVVSASDAALPSLASLVDPALAAAREAVAQVTDALASTTI